ncbi:transcription factor E3 isoform X1 [Tachysurus ichikawai]
MDQFKLSSPLVLTGNVSENWRRWEQRFQIYMTASGAEEKAAKVQVAILLHALGEDTLDVYNTLDVAQADEAELTVDDILYAFKTYCQPKKNTVFERPVLGSSHGRVSHH